MTWEFKLEPTPEQVDTIERIFAVCRSVWNFALRERKDWLNSRSAPVNTCSIEQEYILPADEPYPSYHTQAKRLTLAKEQFPILKDVHSQVLQQVLRTLDRAFEDMRAKKLGFPRFKNKYRMRSFVFPQLSKNPLIGDVLKLPQLGQIRLRLSRQIPEGFEIKQARIVRRANGYFVMLALQLDVSVPDTPISGHPRGLDLGFDKFVATSDNEQINRPRFLQTLQRELKLLQRRLKHMKLGSNNRHKLNQKIARIHQQITDTRKDWHFKLAHRLCNGAGMIFVEDIDFRSWARGMLSKHSADAGFGQFVNILQWVCFKRNVFFAKVDKNYTSQQCPECGTHTGKKELSERIHSCPVCFYTTSRDVAAAQVIRNRGLELVSGLGHSLEVKQTVCGLDAAGASGNVSLAGTGRSRKLKK
ncbi:MAG: IS200/IS605 family transposase ISSoc12 [Chroococcidiopsis sp. SAG 2025]|nr:IS200/IS605 family transposase ISSoc12 [Chroococcidiopsis sp. SAG 2025]MDV2994934.1 IS200/IS605 family transposase ISSoc12 [Chroococcidiopsis sp. SAG 2025]